MGSICAFQILVCICVTQHWFLLYWKHTCTETIDANMNTEGLCAYSQYKHVEACKPQNIKTRKTLLVSQMAAQKENCVCVACVCAKRSCDAEQWFLFIWSCAVIACTCNFVCSRLKCVYVCVPCGASWSHENSTNERLLFTAGTSSQNSAAQAQAHWKR